MVRKQLAELDPEAANPDRFGTVAWTQWLVQLRSRDPRVVEAVLQSARDTGDDDVLVSSLEQVAVYSELDDVARDAFQEMCDRIEPYPGELKAGQVEEIIRFGSKVAALRPLAIQYFLQLVERGELDSNSPPVQQMMEAIAESPP